ncbi:MAG: Mu transposase C-terminal domain-containing protein [Microthrixaceae bacterium]
MDILVKTPDGPQRPMLTTMIDVATRSLLAYTIRMQATKSIDHVTLLAQALVPAQNRPDNSEHRAAVKLSNPHIQLADAEELAQARNARPFLFPRRIHMDNGRDYLGETFISAAERFGIDITLSSVRTPTGKAIVERTFGSINTLFLQYQPGYVGRSPEFRGEHVEKENLLDIWALFELFDDWVVTVYQNRPHSGLRDPMNPSVKWTPNQMVQEASQVTSTLVLPMTDLDYIGLLPSKFRTITSTGVAIGGREYDSPELHPLRHQKSGHKSKKHKWEVKTNPYDLHRVWVIGRDGTFIECLTRDAARLSQPFGELLNPQERESERTIVARKNAELTGTPVHLPPPTSGPVPPEWDHDDDTVPQFDQFNAHQE